MSRPEIDIATLVRSALPTCKCDLPDVVAADGWATVPQPCEAHKPVSADDLSCSTCYHDCDCHADGVAA